MRVNTHLKMAFSFPLHFAPSLTLSRSSTSLSFLLLSLSLLLPLPSLAYKVNWVKGTIGWYGEPSGNGTTAGACVYGDTVKRGYGYMTAAASPALYYKGLACGACYLVKCRAHSMCKTGRNVTITVTSLCTSKASKICSGQNKHLHLSVPAFIQVANPAAISVPAFLRRVPCKRDGGIVFSMYGNPWLIFILISNVGGSGDVRSVQMNRRANIWGAMSHGNGAVWSQSGGGFTGKSMSFILQSAFTKQNLLIEKAIPKDWWFKRDYKTKKNFPAF